jgi:PAS domain-containing protein
MSLFVVVLSVVIQLVAVFCAISTVRVTGKLFAGLCIASALSLMAVRRLIGLSDVVAQPTESHLAFELVGLAISAFMLAGILAIRRGFMQARALEQSLREREQNYRTVADHTVDWECWRAVDGKPLYVSPSCEEITGHPPIRLL